MQLDDHGLYGWPYFRWPLQPRCDAGRFDARQVFAKRCGSILGCANRWSFSRRHGCLGCHWQVNPDCSGRRR
ncbi:UNVERIFIED_CONTAM: hypothetical protein GTU68_003259 [Idotea baltica]|nr:hypothetical protein [Idotea baltica]